MSQSERLKHLLNDKSLLKVNAIAISVGKFYMLTDRTFENKRVYLPKNQVIINRFNRQYDHIYALTKMGEIIILKGDIPYKLVSNKGNRKVAIFIL